MRITLPWSFWVAVAINLSHIEAFTPPNLFPHLTSNGPTLTEYEKKQNIYTKPINSAGRTQLTDHGVNGHYHGRNRRSTVSPFYFANPASSSSDSGSDTGGDSPSSNGDSKTVKKYGQAEVARARTSYLDWCSEYRKTPDERRFRQFVDNFLVMERMARKQGTQIRLNEFADCSATEYQQIMTKGVGAGGGPGQSQLNKNLRFVDTTSKTQKQTATPEQTATPSTTTNSVSSANTTSAVSSNSTSTTNTTVSATTTSSSSPATTSNASQSNSVQAATQQAQSAAQKADQSVTAAQQKIDTPATATTTTAGTTPPSPTKPVKSSTTIPPDEMGSDDVKIRKQEVAKQKALDAERKRLAMVAQAEAAQRTEADQARLKAEQAKAKHEAEAAARKAAVEKERQEKEKAQQEALAEQRRKMEEEEQKRRELEAQAEAAKRAEAAAVAKAKAEAEEKKRKELQAAQAAAKAKAEEEERQRQEQLKKQQEEATRQQRLKEEEERLKKEREEAAEKARQMAEAARLRAEEEARLKKEEQARAAAAEAARIAEEARLKKEEQARAAAAEAARIAEEARLKKEAEEKAAAAEAARIAEEARLKKEAEEKAAAEAKRKAEELAKKRAEEARLKKEQEERAAAEAKKAEEARLKKEQEERAAAAAAEAKRKAEELAKKQAEEARLKKEQEERAAAAAAEAKRKAEAEARKKAEEQARLKREQEARAAAAAEAKRKAEEEARKIAAEKERIKKEQEARAAAAAEAKRKAEEEARNIAAEKERIKKEKEERIAAEAKRKAQELERLAKERKVLLQKKREQQEAAKRKEEATQAASQQVKAREHRKKTEDRSESSTANVDASMPAKSDNQTAKSGAMLESWWNSFRYGGAISGGSRKRQRPSTPKKDADFDRENPSVQARVKEIYNEWCKTYKKSPSESRFPQFMERYLLIEEFSVEDDVEVTLNEYADRTEEEYTALISSPNDATSPSSDEDASLVTRTDRLLSILLNEKKDLQDAEEILSRERDKAVSEHKAMIQRVIEARAADLKAAKLQVSSDTKTLLSKLADERARLRETESNLVSRREKRVAEYKNEQKKIGIAESKRRAEEEALRLREQREIAAKRKAEEDKRRQEEVEAKQRAEAEAKKKAEDKKRHLEAIAREKRKAEEELKARQKASKAEAEANDKKSREEKRQEEIAAKAKAAALAAKKLAKEQKAKKASIEKESEDTVQALKSDSSQSTGSIASDETVAGKLADDGTKSLDEQLAELTSEIDELKRSTVGGANDAVTTTEADSQTSQKAPSKEPAGSTNVSTDSADTLDSKKESEARSDRAESTAEDKELDEEAKKKADEEEELRIRSAYLDWCISYSKKPDMTRIQQFKKNYVLIEEFAKENGKEIKLNEYADCTAAEYERAMKEKEEAKKKEEEEAKKREEEAAAAYKAAVDEASQSFGVDGNKTAVASDETEDDSTQIQDDAVATGDPDDVWKTGEPTMSMWEPEEDGNAWASEGGASMWESSEWGEIDESYSELGVVDPDDPEVRKRVRSAYSNWCKEYNKEPDEGRFPRFKTNYLKMEQMAWEQGSEITLNEFADCSPEEYREAMGSGPSEEEERLERLRMEQEEEAELAKNRKREDRIERLRREQEEEAARLSAKRTVEPVWKVDDQQKKRVKDIRVDWDEDESAAMEEVERMAIAKAEAAARRVEEARKKRKPETQRSNELKTIRSNKNDVDRQLRQKAMNDRFKQDQARSSARNEVQPTTSFDDEKSRPEAEWDDSPPRPQPPADRHQSSGMDERYRDNISENPFSSQAPKQEPSPAFNLGSLFGMGNDTNGKGSRRSSSPAESDPGSDPSQPVVKPPGSFEPKVKAPAYNNKSWQDQYVKNYDPTVGGSFRNGASDSVSSSAAQINSSDENDDWYADSLSQSGSSESDNFELLSDEIGQGDRTGPVGIAPDEAELNATPSGFANGSSSYVDNLSPPKNEKATSQTFNGNSDSFSSMSPPPQPPSSTTTPAVNPPSGGATSNGSYLDNLQPQFPERIESAYQDWCQYYGKEASDDRLAIFATNFLAVEKYHRETGVSLILNELADMTSDEFQSKNG